MNLNDLLCGKGIDPKHVLVFRHKPSENELNKVLPWLAAEKPDLFNAYQQTQGEMLENAMKAMQGTGYVASFIRYSSGTALFVGLYAIKASHPLTVKRYWRIPAHNELKTFGMNGFLGKKRPSILWFDLELTNFCAAWKGKLVVGWPPSGRLWWRRAHLNEMPVRAILEDSALDAAMPEWDRLVLTWEELRVLPSKWKSALSQWRGIYYIFDSSDGKGYVGSAYGEENLLGRWLNYAATGHGGDHLLRKRDPHHFQFSILHRVSPDMEPCDVIRLEASWKNRLHTHEPVGLNDN